MGMTMLGKGRKAISMILDEGSFVEGKIDEYTLPDIGPGAVIGTGSLKGRKVEVIANDAMVRNPRFPVVYSGVIGMEEAYKMATAVYKMIELDKNKPQEEKRPLVLIVDTPGNGPGKVEELFGMNKATGAYQLSLAEARQHGHPIVAMIIGRAISGAFLCHGLQADHILSLSEEFQTMIHVMPLAGIARITKRDIESLTELSKTNPVFASGAGFFYKLGGLEELVHNVDDMKETIDRHITEIYKCNAEGNSEKCGPWGRGTLGKERGGRKTRYRVIQMMYDEFARVEEQYI